MAPDGFRKEVLSQRMVERGCPGTNEFTRSIEYVYAMVCKECGAMVWADDRAVKAHARWHARPKVGGLASEQGDLLASGSEPRWVEDTAGL